jgi:hypothetical protein
MKRILCALLVAILPFGSVLADAPKGKSAKVTLVYQHELPNVPGKSIKGVLVEYGPGGYSPGHTHAKSAFIYATVLEGAMRSQVNDVYGRTEFLRAAGRPPRCQCECQQDEAVQAPRGVRGGHERDGTYHPVWELIQNLTDSDRSAFPSWPSSGHVVVRSRQFSRSNPRPAKLRVAAKVRRDGPSWSG